MSGTDALQQALVLAEQGFHLFPLRKGSKLPQVENYTARASRDPQRIERWARKYPHANWGIATSKFGADEALLAVDVDTPEHGTGAKNGPASLVALELDGKDFPLTREHVTPTGGRHIIYRVPTALRQGVDVLGIGLDVRSSNGYIVAPGSVVEAGEYFVDRPAAPEPAPQWLIDACGAPRPRSASREPLPGIDSARAYKRAAEYLAAAERSVKGAGGDQCAYRVAAQCLALGATKEQTLDLMLSEIWDHGCGWAPDRLQQKIAHAAKYMTSQPGADAPEAQFLPVDSEGEDGASAAPHPLAKLNEEYALVLNGGEASVYYEQRLANGQRKIDSMKGGSFELVLKDRKIDGKPLALAWLSWPKRRFYRGGVDFLPLQDLGSDVLNLWGGFAVQPAPGDWSLLRAHIRDVICGGDEKLDAYVMGWLAHMVQQPHEPAGVALVLRGGQGTGKSTFGKMVGAMFGEHFAHISQRQQLTGKFNSHLACKVMVLADEAFFAGHRDDTPVLKALLTEETMLKEAKGKDIVRVRNCAHVVMASNDEWVVPASEDQRRFCVLDVAATRRNDRAYFGRMRDQMTCGGTAAMLHDLQAIDLAGFDIGDFPATDAGTDQKVASLTGAPRWIYDALHAAWIAGESWEDAGAQVDKAIAYGDYVRRSRDEYREFKPMNAAGFWKRLFATLPGISETKMRIEGRRSRLLTLPPLNEARVAFEKFLGGRPLLWEDG